MIIKSAHANVISRQDIYGILEELYSIEQLFDDENMITEKHVKNYIIIRMVTILEQFFRYVSSTMINRSHNKKFLVKKFTKDSSVSINNDSILGLDYGQITAGSVFASAISFQQYDKIKDIMVNIFKHDSNDIFDFKTNASVLPIEFETSDIEELFDERHNLVHSVAKNISSKYSSARLKKLSKTIESIMIITLSKIDAYDWKTKNPKPAYDINDGLYMLYLSRGHFYKKLKNYLLAESFYNKVIDIKTSVESCMGMGNILNLLKRYEDAFIFYEKAKTIDTTLPNPEILMGLDLFDSKEYKLSVEWFDRVLKNDPENYDALVGRANSLVYLQNTNQALASYEKAIKVYPGRAEAYIDKGNFLNKLDKYDESIKMFTLAIERASEKYELYVNLGNAYNGLKKYNDAIKQFNLALERNRSNSAAFCNKGIALYNLEKYDESIEMYNEAIKLDAEYYDAYHRKADALSMKRDYDKATSFYDYAINLRPDYPDAYHSKGNSLYTQSKYEDALKLYDDALKRDPIVKLKSLFACAFLRAS